MQFGTPLFKISHSDKGRRAKGKHESPHAKPGPRQLGFKPEPNSLDGLGLEFPL
jgi:hypothetical protein